jgi:hypothetical protein
MATVGGNAPTDAQLLRARQILRFCDQSALSPEQRSRMPNNDLAFIRWVVDEYTPTQSDNPHMYKASQGEENFPIGWTTNAHALRTAVDEAYQNSCNIIPRWTPQYVMLRHSGSAHDGFQVPGLQPRVRFRVRNDQGVWQDAPPQRRQLFVKKAVDIAFCLFSTTPSRVAASRLVRDIVTDWNLFQRRHNYHVDPTDENSSDETVAAFLGSLYRTFPTIYLNADQVDMVDGSDAMSRRLVAPETQDFHAYDARRHIELHINAIVSTLARQIPTVSVAFLTWNAVSSLMQQIRMQLCSQMSLERSLTETAS